ncbi:hypothetical protein QYF61_004535 [Mycteria americana]|uniref:Uncharacterized protein n=1 Tax=Mycteria americana TaxID=33587 RepID=A0AAN7RN90_MYCAM|nr:hypothetical protein QYF61_004535 [Mycteria americana]
MRIGNKTKNWTQTCFIFGGPAFTGTNYYRTSNWIEWTNVTSKERRYNDYYDPAGYCGDQAALGAETKGGVPIWNNGTPKALPPDVFLICGDRAWQGVPQNVFGGPCYLGKLTLLAPDQNWWKDVRNKTIEIKHRTKREVTGLSPDCDDELALLSTTERVFLSLFIPGGAAGRALKQVGQLACWAKKQAKVTTQHLNVSLVVRDPKLNTVFEVRPHQCQVQGHDHFPSPAGHTIFDTSQDAIGFLGRLGALLAHIQAAVHQHPQVLLCQAAFQSLFPKPVALHGVAVAQVQDLALSLVEPHTVDLGPSIQPVQVPLQTLPTLQQINTPTQLGVICKHAEGAFDPFVQIIDKDIKQNWPQHRALGNTVCDRPPTGVNFIHHHSLGPAVQPVLYPAKSTPVQAMSSQFLQENAVGNHVKGFMCNLNVLSIVKQLLWI